MLLENFFHFLLMGGYAFYVWCAYTLVVLVMAAGIFWYKRQENVLIKTIIEKNNNENIPAPKITLVTTARQPDL